MSTEFKALLGLELDPSALSNIKNEINKIGDTPVRIRVQLDSSNLNGIQNQLRENLSTANYNAINNISQAVVRNTANRNSRNNITSLSRSLERDVNRLQRTINLSGIDSKFGTSYARQISEINNQISRVDINGLRRLRTQFSDLKKDLSLDTKKSSLMGNIDSLLEKINGLGENESLTRWVTELQNLKGRIPNISSTFALDEAITKFKELKTSSKDTMSTFATMSQRNNLANKIDTVMKENLFGSTNTDAIANLQRYSRQLRNASTAMSGLEFTELSSKFNSTKKSLTSQISKGSLSTSVQSFMKDIERLQKVVSFSGVDSKFGTDYARQIAAISSQLSNVDSKKLVQLKTQFSDLKKDLSLDTKKSSLMSDIDGYVRKINGLGKDEKLTSWVTELQNLKGRVPNISSAFALDEAVAKFKELKVNAKDTMSTFATMSQRNNLANKIDTVLKNNGLKFQYSNSGKDLAAYSKELKSAGTAMSSLRFTEISSKFGSVNQAVKGSTNVFSEFATKVGSLFKYLNSLFLSQVAFDSVIKVFQEVADVDKSMTELYRVTDLTGTKYSMMYDQMTKSAKQYGSTLSDMINSTAAWARLGFDSDQSMGLAEISSMYQHIADIDYNTAVENMVTAYKGFQSQLQEMYGDDATAAMTHIVDVYNELGNNYAINSEQVGNALQRSASALALAGNTFEESAGMATAMSEVIQDPDKAGNALKIVSMRLRGMKGDLQELGEDVDENVVSISKMQTQVLNLTHGKVNIFDDSTGAFKSTYEILKEIAAVYPKLKDTEQADLLETIAGKNRANEVAALLGNWKQAENAVDSALNSDGSALKEYGIYADSIDGKVKKLSATFSELANNLVKSGTAKGAISFLTSILNIVNKLTHSVGTIGTLGIATIITQVVRNLKTLKGIFSDISKNGFNKFWSDSGDKVKGWVKSLSGITSIASIASAIIGTVYSAYNNYRQERRENWQAGIDKADESKANRDNIQSLYSEYQSARNSYDGTAESKTNLANATTSLLSALGMEESEIDNLISKYGLYSDAINDVANNAVLDNLQESVNDAQNGWNDAANLFLDDFKHIFKSNDVVASANKERDLVTQIVSELNDKGVDIQKPYEGMIDFFKGDVKSVDDAVTAYNNLKEIINWFDNEQKEGRLSQSEINDSKLYSNAKSRMSEIEADYEKYIEETENLNKLLAEIEVRKGLENLPEGIDTSTAEGYKSIRSMYASALMNNNLFTGSQEDAESIIDNLVSSGTIQQLTDGFNALSEAEAEAAKETISIADKISSVKSKIKDSNDSEQYDKVSNWIDNLSEEDQDLVYKISVRTDDSALWTLTKWKEELEAFKNTGMTTEDSWDNFIAIMNNTEDTGFQKTLENYSTALSSLKEGFLGISNGTLDQDGIYNLAMQFPELAPYINDTDALKNKILELMNSTNSSAMSEFDSRIQEVGGSSTEAGKALGLLKDQFNQLNGFSFSDIFNIEDATTQFNNFYSAVKNSVTGTGLTSSDIKNVDSMFSGLSGYDKSALFEKTANGIHLNVQEMRKLQEQQEALTKSNFQSELLSLTDQYEAAAEQLSHMTKGTDEYNSKLSEVNSLSKQIDEVSTLATQYEGLTSSYNKWVQAQSTENEGAMYQSMRNYIETAQQEYDSGKTNTDDFISYVSLLSGKEIYTGKQASEAWEQLHQTIEGTSYTAMDFFEEGSDGALNFLKAVNQIDPALANVDKDGNWTIDFGIGTDEDVAKKLGISVEAVQAVLRELTEYDFVMKLDNPYTQINKLKLACDEADNALKAMGQEPVDIDIDTNDVNSEIKKALDLIDEINSSDIDPDVKEAKLEDANSKLDYLIQKKQLASQPAFMYIDTDKLSGGMGKAVGLLQEYQTAVNNVETLKLKGVDGKDLADAESKINALAKKIASLPSSVKVALGFEETDDAETIKKKIAEGSVKVNVDADVSDAEEELNNLDGKEVTTQDNLQVNGKEQLDDIAKSVTKTVNIATVQQVGDRNLWTGSLGIAANTMQVESRKVNVDVSVSGQNQVSNLAATIRRVPDKTARVNASVNGTSAVANLSSTVRRVPDQKMSTVSAVVNGYSYVKNLLDDINKLPNSKTVNIVVNQTTNNSNFIGPTKPNGTASADGTAITGHSFAKGNWGVKDSGTALVGELGQELLVRNGHYYTIGDDSAEFVHYQKGDIIFNAEQTKELLSKGKITASRRRGRSFSSGSGNFGGGGSSSSGGGSSSSGGGSSGGGSNSSGSSSSGSSSASTEKEFKETIDWIEIAIDRIERIISRLKLKTESVYSLWTERNKNLVSEIQKVRDEIDLQGKAYDRYIKEVNSVGLSETYAKKVRDGTIDIEKITNEDLYDKIQEYKQWYEKALDCKDAIDQLKETEAELYKTAFDNISTEYDALITELDNRKSLIEEYINQFENKGYITTSKFYEQLIQEEQENISKLIEERDKLQVALDTAVNSGTIKEGSEAWYEMKNSIDEVTVSIEESKTSILDYANSIREVKWDTFDMILDRMSKITDEADNLIDLFSENDLFEEIGSLTEQGLSTMGLHGLNYNVYMEQARKYANEIEEVQKQLAENPYDKELIERKSELLELQREIVLSAKEEKSAIVELVKQGIQKELDHLQKLIDKYNDALDSEKDLYDYQKKIKDQMKTINSIEKQLLAYQNDDSEETRLKIQELKNSLSDEKDNLKDMEYERYISDQKELLSDLYTEYEDILNARLDDIDKLISDMMDLINDNSGSIRDSIDNISEKLGIVISDEMKDIWHNSNIGNSVKYYDYQKWNDEVTKVSNTTEKIYQSIIDMTKDLSDISESILNNSSMLNNSSSISEQGIIQRSNGDILIPVNQKEIVIESDSVFGKSAVDLFDLYRKESSHQDVPVKNLDGYSIVNNNDLSVQINLPNVKNYDDFKKSLQRDKSFESMVRAMTTDRMFGGSSLKKYRS